MNYLIDTIKKNNQTIFFSMEKELREEKKKLIKKISKMEAKERSILGEWLLKEGLKIFYKLDYKTLTFCYNSFHKPYIKDKLVFYNISHSFDYAICAFSDRPIGVDIEKIRPINITSINIFATKKEQEYILKDFENQYERLFEIYTLKEAYFKCLGTDLKKVLQIEFEIISDDFILCNKKYIELSLKREVSGYIIALCQITKEN